MSVTYGYFIVVHQIFSCLSAVLKTDKSAEVRRAAVLVFTLLLRGLGKNIMEVRFCDSLSQPRLGNEGQSRTESYQHSRDMSCAISTAVCKQFVLLGWLIMDTIYTKFSRLSFA